MKSSNIGGQAVLEGIMMKNRETYSVAVRKPDGEIEVDIDADIRVHGHFSCISSYRRAQSDH